MKKINETKNKRNEANQKLERFKVMA